MGMFRRNFFDANFDAIWCNFSTVLCNFCTTSCNFLQNQFLDLHDSTFMRLQCSNHDNFDVQLVYYTDQLSSSRCATLLPTRGCVVFQCRCTLLRPPVTPTMRLYLPRVEARLGGITAWWFCRKKGHLHTITCNE